MHGFGIARRIEESVAGRLQGQPGLALIAFQRLERAGMVDSEWRQTPTAGAPVYSLTRTGRKRFDARV